MIEYWLQDLLISLLIFQHLSVWGETYSAGRMEAETQKNLSSDKTRSPRKWGNFVEASDGDSCITHRSLLFTNQRQSLLWVSVNITKPSVGYPQRVRLGCQLSILCSQRTICPHFFYPGQKMKFISLGVLLSTDHQKGTWWFEWQTGLLPLIYLFFLSVYQMRYLIKPWSASQYLQNYTNSPMGAILLFFHPCAVCEISDTSHWILTDMWGMMCLAAFCCSQNCTGPRRALPLQVKARWHICYWRVPKPPWQNWGEGRLVSSVSVQYLPPICSTSLFLHHSPERWRKSLNIAMATVKMTAVVCIWLQVCLSVCACERQRRYQKCLILQHFCEKLGWCFYRLSCVLCNKNCGN